jgi:toxin CptA
MSIAVSAVIKPSRCLRALVAVFGLANLAAAFAVGLLLPGRFTWPTLSTAFFLVAGAFLLRGSVNLTKTRGIDISGVGAILLTVQQDMGADDANWVSPRPASGVPAELLAGSTLWPQLMLLRLGTKEGAVLLLPILRDSVSPGVFRALAVAVGAMGGRNKQLQRKHQIL